LENLQITSLGIWTSTQAADKEAITIPIKRHSNPNTKVHIINTLTTGPGAAGTRKSEILDVNSKISD